MALAEHKDLLATLYGLDQAKRGGNAEQYRLLKAQWDLDFEKYKSGQAQKALNTLQSAYDKKDQAYQDLSDKISSYNRQMEFFQNPEKYPAWKSHPEYSANLLGVDKDVIQLARHKNLYRALPQHYRHAAGVAQLGGSPGFQELVAGNELLQTQGTPDAIRQNIAAPGVEAQAQLTTAQANQQNTPQAMITLIDSLPLNDQQKKAYYASVFKLDPFILDAFMLATPQQKVQYLLAQGGAADAVQRTNAGLPADPLKSSTQSLSESEKDWNNFMTTIRHLPQAEQQARIAEFRPRWEAKHGLVPKPSSTGAGGVSTIDKDFYDGLVNIFSGVANRGFAEGESAEYGTLAALLSLNNILGTNQTLEGDPQVLAKRFTAQLGNAVTAIGSDNQTLSEQSLSQLLGNSAEMHNLIVKALQTSAGKGGGAITLAEIGVPEEVIAGMAKASASFTQDPALTAGIRQLIPNYDELTKTPTPLAPVPTTPSRQPTQVNEKITRATERFGEVDQNANPRQPSRDYGWKIHRYDTKGFAGRTVYDKETGQAYETVGKQGENIIVKGQNGNLQLPVSRLDLQSFIYNPGDTVVISVTSNNRQSYPLQFTVVQKGGTYQGQTLQKNEYLLRPVQGNTMFQANELLIVNFNAIKGKVNATRSQ